jgi:hypothetical protein
LQTDDATRDHSQRFTLISDRTKAGIEGLLKFRTTGSLRSPLCFGIENNGSAQSRERL